MQRRCTESSCRRIFSIGHAAPIQCPYCGTTYPRVQPDPHSPRDTFGYSVRADFTEMLSSEIRRIIDRYSWPRFIYFQPQPVAVHYGISLREAQDLCRRFRMEGVSADVITTWDAQRQHLVFLRR